MAASTETASISPFPKITLHWLEVSRSHRILWLLEELQIPYELKTYKRGKDKSADPKLREVHPLGKSPIITIEIPGRPEPLVIAESALIVEYLCEHYGKHLVPKQYQDAKEGQIGGETEEWLRYRYYMHYAEGSIMPLNLVSILANNIKNSPVPFFIRPITNGIAAKMNNLYLGPNFKTTFDFIEDQLATAPDGGEFLCGQQLTAADVLMSFPLEAGQSQSGFTREQYPKIWAYVDRLYDREAWKRSVKKIEEVEGKFVMKL